MDATGCHQGQGDGRRRGRGLAAAAVASGLALGLRDALEPQEPAPIVINHWAEEPVGDGILLFFHPEVPEATLVYVPGVG